MIPLVPSKASIAQVAWQRGRHHQGFAVGGYLSTVFHAPSILLALYPSNSDAGKLFAVTVKTCGLIYHSIVSTKVSG
jgi:hypothetical protein